MDGERAEVNMRTAGTTTIKIQPRESKHTTESSYPGTVGAGGALVSLPPIIIADAPVVLRLTSLRPRPELSLLPDPLVVLSFLTLDTVF